MEDDAHRTCGTNARNTLRKMGGMILIASMVVWFLSYYPRSEEGGTTAHYENSYLGRLGQSCAPIFSPLGLNWKAGVALLSGVPAKEIVVSTLGVLYPDGGEAASAPGAGTTEIVTGSGEKIEIGNLPEGSIAIIGGADGQTAIRIAENADAQVGTGTQAGKVAELAGEDEETVNLSRKLLASGDFTQASALAFLVFILLYFPCIATIAAIGAEAGWKWATAAVAYNTVLAWVVAWAVYRLFMWLLTWGGRTLRSGVSASWSQPSYCGGCGASSGAGGAADARRAPVRIVR